MPTLLSAIETTVRQRLVEITPRFWTSDELIGIAVSGIKDLWRDIVDLKQEHFLTVDNTNVTLPANTTQLSGVPADVHKIYLIEPRDLTENGSNHGLVFTPLDYNHRFFASARGMDPIDPTDATIYYAITGQGSPVNAPTIRTAPQTTSAVNLSFCYVPTLSALTAPNAVPIPGEADNALVAWTVAYALAKERDDKSPDPNWLSVYATEKQHLLQSLGLREYQEAHFAEAVFEDMW